MIRAILILVGAQVTMLLLMRPLILRYLGIRRGLQSLDSIDQSLKELPAVKTARAIEKQRRARAA